MKNYVVKPVYNVFSYLRELKRDVIHLVGYLLAIPPHDMSYIHQHRGS